MTTASPIMTTADPTATAPPRRTRLMLSPRLAYAFVAAVIGLALFASGTPSPLYSTYRQLWGFSPVVLTLVYATYAFGVLTTLLLAGRVSDVVGRRPVLLTALGTLMGATIIFMLADSVAWLFAARAVQGLATGLAVGAASAALLDLHPRRDPAGVGLTNGVVSAGGMGLGVFVSAMFVELLPAPRVLPYVALFVLFAVAFGCALRMPESVASRSRLRLTPSARASRPPRVARSCSPRSGSPPRGRSAVCSCPSARSSRGACSTPPTTWWRASASWPSPAPPRSRSSRSGGWRRGPVPPRDRWHSPPAW